MEKYRQLYPNELYHYGIMGMKWGVRRYQNPDGTLTDAGKRHYNSEVSSDSGRYAFGSKNAARAKAMKNAGYSRSEITDAFGSKNAVRKKAKKTVKSSSDLVYIPGWTYKVSEILKGAADFDGVTIPESLLEKLFSRKYGDLD